MAHTAGAVMRHLFDEWAVLKLMFAVFRLGRNLG